LARIHIHISYMDETYTLQKLEGWATVWWKFS